MKALAFILRFEFPAKWRGVLTFGFYSSQGGGFRLSLMAMSGSATGSQTVYNFKRWRWWQIVILVAVSDCYINSPSFLRKQWLVAGHWYTGVYERVCNKGDSVISITISYNNIDFIVADTGQVSQNRCNLSLPQLGLFTVKANTPQWYCQIYISM